MDCKNLSSFEKLDYLRKNTENDLWNSYLEDLISLDKNILYHLCNNFKDYVLINDVVVFEKLFKNLKETDKDYLFVELLVYGRLDLLKKSLSEPLIGDNVFKLLLKNANVLKAYKNYLILENKNISENDFKNLIIELASMSLKQIIDLENVADLVVYFRKNLRNIDYTVTEYFCSNIQAIKLPYREEFVEDAYKNIDKCIDFVLENRERFLFSKLLEYKYNNLTAFVYSDKGDSDKSFDNSVKIIALQNLEFLFPFFYKIDENNSSLDYLKTLLRKNPVYFLYMNLKSLGLSSVDEMVVYLTENSLLLENYVSSVGLTGLISGTDMKESLSIVDINVCNIPAYKSLYNFIDNKIMDGNNNVFLTSLALNRDVHNIFNMALKRFENILKEPLSFASFDDLVKRKLLKENNNNNNNNNFKDLIPVFTDESKNIFLDSSEFTENDIIKKYIKYVETNKLNQYRKIAKAEHFLKKIDYLYESFPNFKDVTENIEKMLRLQLKGNEMFYISPLILAGPPGVGKTYYLSTVMKMAGTFMNMISYQNMTANFILTGSSSQWSGGTPGLVFNTLMNTKCEVINPIIVLDEIDKNGSGINYSTEDCLLGLLETHTAKTFKDECINLQIDASHITWLATANNIENISEPLQSRFEIVNIPVPNMEEKRKLIKNIYKTILDGNTWGHVMDKELPRETIEKLLDVFNNGASRDLRKLIIKSCANSIKNESIVLLPKYIDFKESEKLPWDA